MVQVLPPPRFGVVPLEDLTADWWISDDPETSLWVYVHEYWQDETGGGCLYVSGDGDEASAVLIPWEAGQQIAVCHPEDEPRRWPRRPDAGHPGDGGR